MRRTGNSAPDLSVRPITCMSVLFALPVDAELGCTHSNRSQQLLSLCSVEEQPGIFPHVTMMQGPSKSIYSFSSNLISARVGFGFLKYLSMLSGKLHYVIPVYTYVDREQETLEKEKEELKR